MDSTEVHRLRGEVISLWRRIFKGGTVVKDEQSRLHVGVIQPINPVNVNGLRDGPLLRHLTSVDISDAPSLRMKSNIEGLMQEIKDLQDKMSEMTGKICENANDAKPRPNKSWDLNIEQSAKHSKSKTFITSKCPEVEYLSNHIAYIKVQFQTLKRSGRQMFADLEVCESELLKDVNALKDVISNRPRFNPSTERLQDKVLGQSPEGRIGVGIALPPGSGPSCSIISNERCEELPVGVKLPVDIDKFSDPCVRPMQQDCVSMSKELYFKHKWDEKDHSMFVKVCRKFRNKSRRQEELLRMFPYKSQQDIEEHAASYESYVSRKDDLKKVLANWKKNKEAESQALEEKLAEEKKQSEIQEQKLSMEKEMKRRKEREKCLKELASQKAIIEQKKNLDAVVEPQNICSKEQKCFLESDTKASSQTYTAEERREIAQCLKAYHLKREMQIEEERSKKEEEEVLKRDRFNAEHRLRYLKKDEEFVQRKKAVKESQMKLMDERRSKLEKLKGAITVNRDRDRLLQPTQSHLAHMASSNLSSIQRDPRDVDLIPRLGVPLWRQGL